MSRHQDALSRARDVIGRMSVKMKWPDPKYPGGKEMTLFDRARDLADAWAADRAPATGTRGGSSSSDDQSERREADAIQRRAAAAVDRFARATKLAEELDQMYRDVTYLTSITKERPDVPEETLAGCKSCSRAGINEPVFHKSKVSGLCRWCGEKLDEYDDLPLEAVQIRHTRGPKAATLWLQQNANRKDEPVFHRCGNYATIDGVDVCCYKAVHHDGECAGVGPDGKRKTWQVLGAAAIVA